MNKSSPLISEFGSAEEEAAYDAWYRNQVEAALKETDPGTPHDEVMAQMRTIVAKAREHAVKE